MRRRCRWRLALTSGSLSREDERGRLATLRGRFVTFAGFTGGESSDMGSSSVSDDRHGWMKGGCGKMKVGKVGIVTGSDGLEDRLRCGNVGEMGDDWGVLRRRKVEIGVLAMRSGSNERVFGRFGFVRPAAE